MGVKKEEFDDDDDPQVPKDKLLIYFGIGFLLISEIFLYLLDVKTGASFGIVQAVFGVLAAVLITLFLAWVRYIMKTNRYLALCLMTLGILAVSYALTRRYQGVYTTTFLVIGIALGIVYTLYNFVKFKR